MVSTSDRTNMRINASAWNDSANDSVVVVGDVLLPDDNPVLALVLFSFCLATVFGNVLVIAAVIRERYLHTVTNYFITSLAVADCLVGSIVMPFSVAVEMQSDRRWIFGRDLWYVRHYSFLQPRPRYFLKKDIRFFFYFQ